MTNIQINKIYKCPNKLKKNCLYKISYASSKPKYNFDFFYVIENKRIKNERLCILTKNGIEHWFLDSADLIFEEMK